MGIRGRKPKAGKRKNGRLVPLIDKGTERAQATVALFGTDGCDAVGRAYRAGFLGEGSEAKARLDAARKVAKIYWQAYATGRYKCPLADDTHGSGLIDHEKVKRREQWLREVTDCVNRMGRDVRQAFDQLVIEPHPDSGPPWLDALLWDARRDAEPSRANMAKLCRAMDALDIIAQEG